MDCKKTHSIGAVSRRTGLSPDVLRAWEQRYGAVEPRRSAGGQRVYADTDIQRLRLICQALDGGRRIGQVARLATAELERLVREDRQATGKQNGGVASRARARAILDDALDAVLEMDARSRVDPGASRPLSGRRGADRPGRRPADERDRRSMVAQPADTGARASGDDRGASHAR